MSKHLKSSSPEDEYFARQEIEKKKRLAAQVQEKMQNEEREHLKKLHFMHCSKCGLDLHSVTFQGFIIEKCFHCGAVVLDKDEFEKLGGKEEDFITAIVGLFK